MATVDSKMLAVAKVIEPQAGPALAKVDGVSMEKSLEKALEAHESQAVEEAMDVAIADGRWMCSGDLPKSADGAPKSLKDATAADESD